MMEITIRLDAPQEDVQGVKEVLAMALEPFGTPAVSNVRVLPDQTKINGF